MGITPIVNLAPLPLTSSIHGELEPAPMERVEQSARTGDETYTPSNKKSARGSEDNGSEDSSPDDEYAFDAPQDQLEHRPATRLTRQNPDHQVSFFA
jgi:hypothetical protein